jgi:hypothetical protein
MRSASKRARISPWISVKMASMLLAAWMRSMSATNFCSVSGFAWRACTLSGCWTVARHHLRVRPV